MKRMFLAQMILAQMNSFAINDKTKILDIKIYLNIVFTV